MKRVHEIKRALLPQVYDAVSRRAWEIAENFFRAQEFAITDKEFVQAFIDPDHVAPLLKVEELCGRIGKNDNVKIKYTVSSHSDAYPFVFMVRFPDKPPIIVPDYVEADGLHRSCPPELRERFDMWAYERIRVGNMVGDFLDCLSVFNEWLPDPRSMSIMLPVMTTLVTRASLPDKVKEDTLRRMSKGDFKIPPLPPQVTKRMNDATSLITAMAMLPTQKRSEDTATIERSYMYEYMTTNPFMFEGVAGCPQNHKTRGASL